jgi:hypothetical protein
MSISPRILKASALLISGAALGGAGGYAASASGASPVSAEASAGKHAKAVSRDARLRRAVSITAVVPDGHGSFATLSIERGTLVSDSSGELTLEEGTRQATYKSVTVALPSTAVVRLSRKPSSLAALSAGDRIEVLQSPRRTTVIARTPKRR